MERGWAYVTAALQGGSHLLRDAKISKLHLIILAQQQVGSLKASVGVVWCGGMGCSSAILLSGGNLNVAMVNGNFMQEHQGQQRL